eukprot:TRINITY_DN414_c0_g1_i1.p1 TRINITY_DN414_c0_g1~~TRINITY_DN414_c0_g1_i1.p1  ORF type:complete len:140 (+),score=58.55 TRINITY_DN414_c0_g1_i1:53-472(+)
MCIRDRYQRRVRDRNPTASIMISALLLIALIGYTMAASSAAGNACTAEDGTKLTECGSAVGDCTSKAGTDTDAICECYGAYTGCLNSLKCTGALKDAADMAAKGLCDALVGTDLEGCCSSASGLAASVAAVLALAAARL